MWQLIKKAETGAIQETAVLQCKQEYYYATIKLDSP